MQMKLLSDFLPEGASKNSIIPLLGDNPLLDITNPEAGLSNQSGEVYTADYNPESISDVIAHITYMEQLYQEKNYYAISEWRGMLCDIFFTGLIGGKNSIYKIPVSIRPDLNSDLLNLIRKRLISDRSTGFTAEDQYIPIYKKQYKGKDEYFALVLPGFIILPFTTYRHDMFTDKWTDSSSGTPRWDNKKILNYLRENSEQAKLLLQYLVNIQNNCFRGWGYNLVNDFIKEILEVSVDESLTIPDIDPNIANLNLEEKLLKGYSHSFGDNSVVSGQVFEDNLLCFKSYSDGEIDGNAEIWTDTWNGYRIDTAGTYVTPIKVERFCLEDNCVYVIPPFNSQFVSAVKSGIIQFQGWNATLSDDDASGRTINVSVSLSFNRNNYEITDSFDISNIYVAEELPYISLWPYVNTEDKWHEFFVGVASNEFNDPIFNAKYQNIDAIREQFADHKLRKVTKDQVIITVAANDPVEFEISANPFGTPDDQFKDFKIIKSTSFPDYIGFSFRDADRIVNLGYWQVIRKNAPELKEEAGRPGVIGLDFATTATVEALFVNGNANQISAPGTYLYDIFNPMYRPQNAEDFDESYKRWKLFQAYYMFGCDNQTTRKIYTYGQYNTARSAGQLFTNDTNYITGRIPFVSDDYIRALTDDSSVNHNDSDIYSTLKWPQTDEIVNNINKKDIARKNFIINVLSLGLLQARIKGCDQISVKVSYPKDGNGDIVTRQINGLIPYLCNISSFKEIGVFSNREAECNAAFLLEGRAKGWHDREFPNPSYGFMFVDIGGGTTDIAVCRYDNNNIPFDQKLISEASFKYAGREIVDIPLLQTPIFNSMWSPVSMNELLSRFNSIGDVNPEDSSNELNRCISAVGYILDKATLSQQYTGDRMLHYVDKMKLKYLGLFWVLGKYVRKLSDDGKLNVDLDDEYYYFKIFLTGCASKGIDNFCKQNDPDFLEKCKTCASLGYFKPGEQPFAFIDVAIISDADKREVAFGLTLLDNNQIENKPDVQKSGRRAIGGPINVAVEEEKEPAGPVITHDNDEIFAEFEYLINSINLAVPNNALIYNYKTIKQQFSADIQGWVANPLYKDKIKQKISDPLIYSDLYALYILEKLLDSNKKIGEYL